MAQRVLRTATIVGARPQFVKMAPVLRAMREARLTVVDQVIHTGQHYDDALSRIFFAELELPAPQVNLGVGSATAGRQTARMLEAIETELRATDPQVVIVYGDTNSTLAGALAAAKLHIPVAHVEAGLRSFNRQMPEELNRIVTDHVAELLLAPTQTAVQNLATEGLAARTRLTGDVMYDAVLQHARRALAESRALERLDLAPGSYGLLTIHRAENTTARDLVPLLHAVTAAARRFGPLIFPLHPRTAGVLGTLNPPWKAPAELLLIEPQGYLDMLALLMGARCVLTDSGGLQKEAYFVNCPCITLRNETEWLETLGTGANQLAGADGAALAQLLERLQDASPRAYSQAPVAIAGPFGGGDAARRVVEALCDLAEVQS